MQSDIGIIANLNVPHNILQNVHMSYIILHYLQHGASYISEGKFEIKTLTGKEYYEQYHQYLQV